LREDNVIVVIWESAVQMIRRFTLASTENILQLADILSPHGETTAKLQLGKPAAFAHDDREVVENDPFLRTAFSNWQIIRMAKPIQPVRTKKKSPCPSRGRIELKCLSWRNQSQQISVSA
jgi:hypothetical protein